MKSKSLKVIKKPVRVEFVTKDGRRVAFKGFKTMTNPRTKMSAIKIFALKVKKSKISGMGLFATEAIPWGKRIIEYTGERISAKEGDRREKIYTRLRYCPLFSLDDKTDIDALLHGNDSIFINHSEEKANVAPLRENGKIWFYSLGDIKRGEELLFDYGFDPAKTENKPHGRTQRK